MICIFEIKLKIKTEAWRWLKKSDLKECMEALSALPRNNNLVLTTPSLRGGGGGGGKKYIDMPLTISIGVFATNMN